MANYFSQVFAQESSLPIGSALAASEEHGIDSVDIDQGIVLNCLMNLDAGKSMGPDNLHPGLLKELSAHIAGPCLALDNRNFPLCCHYPGGGSFPQYKSRRFCKEIDEIIFKLKQSESSKNFVQSGKRTSLHYAAYWASQTCVQTLILQGSDLTARDEYGLTPVIWACESDQLGNLITLMKVDNLACIVKQPNLAKFKRAVYIPAEVLATIKSTELIQLPFSSINSLSVIKQSINAE
ncbi:unnamed protein product [Trichobilharzia regenti]|nr:unnamed protein product [Trichobilharzia regenti]